MFYLAYVEAHLAGAEVGYTAWWLWRRNNGSWDRHVGFKQQYSTILHPFGNGVYHLFTVIWWMAYYCFAYIGDIYIYSCCVCPSLPSLATSLRWRWRKHVVFQTCWNDQADTDVEGRMTTVRPSPSRGEYAIGEELNIFLLIGEYRVLY